MQLAQGQVCVVVPAYRAALGPGETMALQQCCKVLGRYPMVLAQPQSLDSSRLMSEFGLSTAEKFEDRHFASVASYNDWLLTPEFYARFSAYQYILIHQLDAFVFRDELSEWCARGYDYIGAPWMDARALSSGLALRRLLFKRWLYQKLEKKDRDGVSPHPAWYRFGVGNGGFSLRRVQAMIDVLRQLAGELAQLRGSGKLPNEDLFYGLMANRRGAALNIPGYATAAGFAIEFCPARSVQLLNGGRLPFGCHAFDKHEPDYWRAVFATYGYQL